jgi:hypothetical protein
MPSGTSMLLPLFILGQTLPLTSIYCNGSTRGSTSIVPAGGCSGTNGAQGIGLFIGVRDGAGRIYYAILIFTVRDAKRMADFVNGFLLAPG